MANKVWGCFRAAYHDLLGTWSRVATGQFGIAAETTVGKYWKIAKLQKHAQILYAVAYVFAMSAASPAPIMESTRGGGRRPSPLVEAAAGRLHYGCWGGGKHSKNISKCI